ncbi:UNKNOWN [Stylonychia lemnae]|uniref:Uncharacterized protein n=1 Tax=Stylonychia lemnae TaxID=5949 RepID=A0A077ZRS1_STYLE|nr:UNKNOWN [Stylonychia lemnae]|eukprot:CDW72169.1 UNKNOWN [Stylonychia lemnae]
MIQDQQQVEQKAQEFCTGIINFKKEHENTQNQLNTLTQSDIKPTLINRKGSISTPVISSIAQAQPSESFILQQIKSSNDKYQQEIKRLQIKKQIINSLYSQLTFTQQEKNILFGDEDEEDNDMRKAQQNNKPGDISRFLKIDLNQQDNSIEDEESKFDKFKEDFFKSLAKLKQMEDIQQLLQKQPKSSQVLASSIAESIKYVEDHAYVKLVKHLRTKIRLFDTPLENQPEFLTFMKVTLKMLKSKSNEMYGHIVNDLLQSRARYIDLSYQEKSAQIFNKKSNQSKKSQENGINNENSAKNVAQQIAWLHETLLNELFILDHTSIDKSRYLDALNSIFSRNLAKQLKQRLDTEINNQEGITQCFELYYLFISFTQIMQEQFFNKSQIAVKQDLSDFYILSFLNDLKSKSLSKLVESTDQFLSKMSNMFWSQAAQQTLQLERYIQLIIRIFSKLIEVVKNDKKDLDVFKRRIYIYAISRIIPSIQTLKTNTNEQQILPANLILLYNYFDFLKSEQLLPRDLAIKEFKDELKLVQERLDELVNSIREVARQGIMTRQLFLNLTTNANCIDEFKHALEEFEEDLEYEEIKLSFLHSLNNTDMRVLIVELIKSDIVDALKKSLEFQIDDEVYRIQQNTEMTEDQKNKAERRLDYLEFEIIEKFEYIKRKIT